MTILSSMLCALSVKLCLITKTVSRAAVEGKCQRGVSLYHGQDTHTGVAEVREHLVDISLTYKGTVMVKPNLKNSGFFTISKANYCPMVLTILLTPLPNLPSE